MICPKCGKKLPDGAAVCDACGADLGSGGDRVQESVGADNAAGNTDAKVAAAGGAGKASGADGAKGPKKSFWKKLCSPAGITVLAVVAAVVAVCIIFSNSIAAFFRRTFYPAEKYAGYIVGEKLEEMVGSIGNDGDGPAHIRTQAEISFEVNDDLTSAVSLFVPSDGDLGYVKELIPLLNDVTLKYDSSMKDGDSTYLLMLCSGGESVLSCRITFDGENGVIFSEFPELTDCVLYSETAREGTSYAEQLAARAELMRLFAGLDKSFAAYASAAFEGNGNGEKSKETLTAGGISEKCTELTFAIDAKSVRGALEAVLGEAENDEALFDFLEQLDKVIAAYATLPEGEGSKDSLLGLMDDKAGNLDRVEERLTEFFGDSRNTLKLYVSNDEDIIGLVLETEGADGDRKIWYGKAISGREAGFEFGAEDGETSILFSGKGGLSGDLFSGDFTFSYNGDEFAIVNVSELSREAMHKGIWKGNFTLTPTATLYKMLLGEQYGTGITGKILSSLLSSLTVRVTADGDENSSDWKIDLLNGDKSLAGIRITTETSEPEDISIPDRDGAYDLSDPAQRDEFFASVRIDESLRKAAGELGLSETLTERLLSEIEPEGGWVRIPNGEDEEPGEGSETGEMTPEPDEEVEKLVMDYAAAFYSDDPGTSEQYLLVPVVRLYTYYASCEGIELTQYLSDIGLSSADEIWDGWKALLKDAVGRSVSSETTDMKTYRYSEAAQSEFMKKYEAEFAGCDLDINKVSAVSESYITVKVSGAKSDQSIDDLVTVVCYDGDWRVMNLSAE